MDEQAEQPTPPSPMRDRQAPSRSRAADPADVVIRAGRRDDLLALLAIRLGFHPQDSLLVGCVEGPRSRLGFVVRVDLPAPDDIDEHVRTVVDVVLEQDATRVVVVAIGDVDLAGEVVDAVTRLFDAADVDVVEAMVADGERWWCRLCPEGACDDSAGTPYDPSTSTPMAQAVLAGVSVLPSRMALADHFSAVTGPRRAAVAAAAQDVEAALQQRWHTGGAGRPLHRTPAVLMSAAARLRRLVARQLGVAAPDDSVTAELAVLTRLVPVRDVAWSLLSRPQARPHAELWAHVARHAPIGLSAAPLALAGFASWLQGDGAAAWCAVDRCLTEHPGYSMGMLLAQALEQAVPPDTWTPVPADLLVAALDPPPELDRPDDLDDPAA